MSAVAAQLSRVATFCTTVSESYIIINNPYRTLDNTKSHKQQVYTIDNTTYMISGTATSRTIDFL